MKPNTRYYFECESHLEEAWAIKGLQSRRAVLMLGEINNMPGKVAVVNADGRVVWGVHSHYFTEAETQ